MVGRLWQCRSDDGGDGDGGDDAGDGGDNGDGGGNGGDDGGDGRQRGTSKQAHIFGAHYVIQTLC